MCTRHGLQLAEVPLKLEFCSPYSTPAVFLRRGKKKMGLANALHSSWCLLQQASAVVA